MNTSVTPDRIAIVTGTSSGIGAALAEALLAAHWAVVGIARRPADFESASYTHLQIDLGDLDALQTFVENKLNEVLNAKKWERVGLVNNAAVLGDLKSVREMEPQTLAKTFAINVVAPLSLMGALTRLVADETPLRIANISSGAATVGLPGLADYCGSKAALRLAGMSLAAEVEQPQWSGDTAVFSYEPGVVDTAMQDVARQADPAAFPSHEFFHSIHERGMLLAPEDVVTELISFLASDPEQHFTEMRHGTS